MVTVAIPTLDAGHRFVETLAALAAQRVAIPVELLVCDSGSVDGTVERARRSGARVIEIPRVSFSHGGTRNLLMRQARGSHVAFLTQDAVPVGDGWLSALLDGFTLGPDVGLAFGPYLPRPEASLSVRRELTAWFAQLSPDGRPHRDALPVEERGAPASRFLGPLGFFTDANGCVRRDAWKRTPFREVAYAEDHLLARDMLNAGFSKVYVPGAAVLHSHEYSLAGWLRRSFDETRAVAEVYGSAPAARWHDAARNLRGAVAADVRLARHEAGDDPALAALGSSVLHHGARTVGAMLGARAARMPTGLVARLSLEGRGEVR